MELSKYVGRTPRDYEGETTVERVASHRRWDVDVERRGDCSHCGAELELRERHLLVTLTGRSGNDGERHYLCGQSCLDEWFTG
ncbi:hypothetical protein SAMN04487948_102251 [Halogranum amylolyticum]|uniref:MYM-type Zinc finger with FCS sequence motif-containing protein n=1 Tax=Halogranum amylolyticum TaxID=660520 RepID=A0A1H8PE66_9EURY|nr:hypothetical protein [Halogranum amylolyticum]SEO40225.1 hypothetical protein SAMN04487948_102251 [Halogranum amylolyticum]